MSSHHWTEQQDEVLARLWMQGASVNEIALQINVSRNAVCGRRYRLDLPRRSHSIPCKQRLADLVCSDLAHGDVASAGRALGFGPHKTRSLWAGVCADVGEPA